METVNLLTKLLPTIKTYLSCADYQSALRQGLELAQAATHKEYILTLEGTSYPTLSDMSLLTLPYNDIAALKTLCREYHGRIAALLLEPVPTSQGLILPHYGYLEEISDLAQQEGFWLFFDETTTLFQAAVGGSQTLYQVEPQLTCYRNLLFSKDALLPQKAPLPQEVFADELMTPEEHYALESLTAILTGGLERLARQNQLPLQLHRLGTLYSIYMSKEKLEDYADYGLCDWELYSCFCQELLKQNIKLPESQFSTNILPPSITAEAIEEFLQKAALACIACRKN